MVDPESSFDLLERVRSGDSDALSRLLQRYMPALTRWARGRLPQWARDVSDTQDLVQDTVMQVMKHLNEFRPQRPGALQAYLRQEEAYRNHLAELEAKQGVAIEGSNPLEYRVLERNELKRSAVSMLTGQHFVKFSAILESGVEERGDRLPIGEAFGGIPWDGLGLCSHASLLDGCRQPFGGLDIAVLRALVAAAQQDHQHLAPLDEVHPVAGAVVDAQLADTLAHRLHVTELPA